MINFEKYQHKEISMHELIGDLGHKDLFHQTNEMVDKILDLIAGCDDRDITFTPEDPQAYDDAAATDEELTMPWTLGHVIVHTTASAEEAAAIAVELARGVPFRGGRSRSEVHWSTMKNIGQCRSRLEESRRMRIASLIMWPDEPYIENTLVNHRGEEVNAIGSFMSGLTHEVSHLVQIRAIVAQAHRFREGEM